MPATARPSRFPVYIATFVASAWLVLFSAADPCPTWAQEATGGGEFIANSFFAGDQDYPDIASQPGGTYIVVWNSAVQDGDGEAVQGRQLDAAGIPTGTEFDVNTTTAGSQDTAAVAVGPGGAFMVVWESQGQDGSSDAIVARRFSSSTSPMGGEIQINTHTLSGQDDPDIAVDSSGEYVIVWESAGQDGNNGGVFGRRVASSGSPIGGEFAVNTQTLGAQVDAAVGRADAGQFVVIWTSIDQDGDGGGVFGQRFSATASPQGTEFQINSFTTGVQDEAAVAMDADGEFVAVWESFGQDGETNGVFGQRFSSGGATLGTEFQANTETAQSQDDVAVAYDASGGFIVTWESSLQDGDESGIFAQRFAATGSPVGTEFQVNLTTSADQEDPAVAAGPGGDFVVAWNSFGQDASYNAIVTRRYTVGGGACPDTPQVGCRSGQAERSSIQFKKKGGAKDKIKWKYGAGAATDVADFLNPPGNPEAAITVCFYDNDGVLIQSSVAPAGTCNGKPCWAASGSSGYKYKDRFGLASGVTGMKLKAGETDKTSIQVKGKGGALALPFGPYALPVTAQITIADNTLDTCWESTFSITTRNTLDGLRAKGP